MRTEDLPKRTDLAKAVLRDEDTWRLQVGARIREARIWKGMTQTVLGELIDGWQATVDQAQRGQLTIKTLLLISEALNVPTDWLLGNFDMCWICENPEGGVIPSHDCEFPERMKALQADVVHREETK